MQKMSGVYWLIHQTTQRFYIGSTSDFHTRKSIHIRSLETDIILTKNYKTIMT